MDTGQTKTSDRQTDKQRAILSSPLRRSDTQKCRFTVAADSLPYYSRFLSSNNMKANGIMAIKPCVFD